MVQYVDFMNFSTFVFKKTKTYEQLQKKTHINILTSFLG